MLNKVGFFKSQEIANCNGSH